MNAFDELLQMSRRMDRRLNELHAKMDRFLAVHPAAGEAEIVVSDQEFQALMRSDNLERDLSDREKRLKHQKRRMRL